eukprot:TRINITY_DN7476_c0_g2_i1.p1 TRINITY_DN7476_c0_g2~~TRINITY_DN7476_c0_g2_i1.p1  ORF type:complete len:130 (+),score=5.10 TRINITY_DN7476_c0_g2_i1:86-475(+)
MPPLSPKLSQYLDNQAASHINILSLLCTQVTRCLKCVLKKQSRRPTLLALLVTSRLRHFWTLHGFWYEQGQEQQESCEKDGGGTQGLSGNTIVSKQRVSSRKTEKLRRHAGSAVDLSALQIRLQQALEQ